MSWQRSTEEAQLSAFTLPSTAEFALLMGSLASAEDVFAVANLTNKSQHHVAAFLDKLGKVR